MKYPIHVEVMGYRFNQSSMVKTANNWTDVGPIIIRQD